MNPRTALGTVLFAGLFSALAPAARANDDVIVLQFLQGTGNDADARCRVRWRDKGDAVDFNVELEQMSTGSYDLLVAGVQRGTLDVDGSGEGEIEFVTPADSPKPLFDFEVFGEQLVIQQGGTVYFDDVFDPTGDGGPPSGGGGSGKGGSSKGRIEVFMVNVGPDGNAKGRLRFEQKSSGPRFDIEMEHLDAGAYELLVGGTSVAAFDISSEELQLDFRDPPDDSSDSSDELHFLLDFEPRGQQVDIVQGATVFLTGVLPASGTGAPPKAGKLARDLGRRKGDKLQVLLAGTGLLPAARGKATLGQSGETELEVEIEGVTDGAYGLCVGGIERAVINVVSGDGQVAFSDSPGGGQLLLDFAVKGELFEVKVGTDVILSTVFPNSVPAALGAFKKEKTTTSLVKANIQNAGADLDVSGQLNWRRNAKGRERLKLAVIDLPAGTYTVRVGGVDRGTVTITKQDGRATASFDSSATEGSKKQPLDFDVRGESVEIVDGSDQVQLTLLVP